MFDPTTKSIGLIHLAMYTGNSVCKINGMLALCGSCGLYCIVSDLNSFPTMNLTLQTNLWLTH